ncbi:MAG: branched-chain amino acid ABC transporter permease [Pseudomonadota bacterium]
MTSFLQFFITGLSIGCIYGIIALGFVIIFNATDIVNLAQGEFVMLGGMVMAFFSVILGLPMILSFVLTLIVVVLVGCVLHFLVRLSPKRAPLMTLILITIAFSIIISGGAKTLWGTDPQIVPPFSKGGTILISGVSVQPQILWTMGVSLLVILAMYVFFKMTIYGKAMRACSENPLAAGLLGVNPTRMALVSFCLSGGLGAMAGIIITPLILMDYQSGLMLGLKGMTAAVLFGFTSAGGAFFGGLLLGLSEGLGAGLISSAYKDAIAFGVLIIYVFAVRKRMREQI